MVAPPIVLCKALMVVRHIVFFKLSKKGFENIKTIKQKLENLQNDIPYIDFLEVGLNFCPQVRAYDISLTVCFDSREDLTRYSIEDYHIKVVQYLKSLGTTTAVVDYEI